MPHFRFHSNGAPFPGTCVFSGANRDLWEIGSMTVQGQVLPVLLSDRVLQELATHAGFIEKRKYDEVVAENKATIAKQQAQIEATPNLIKEFLNDVNVVIGNFVTSLASVDVSDKPVQSEGNQADTGSSAAEPGSSPKGGKGKKQTSQPSDESSEQ
jgi:cobalamin biosynthesis Mg chelatase CobN